MNKPAVNFINVERARFLYERAFWQLFLVTCMLRVRGKTCWNDVCTKNSRVIMLMKLTASFFYLLGLVKPFKNFASLVPSNLFQHFLKKLLNTNIPKCQSLTEAYFVNKFWPILIKRLGIYLGLCSVKVTELRITWFCVLFMYLEIFFVKSLPWPLDTHGSKLSFSSQYIFIEILYVKISCVTRHQSCAALLSLYL